MENILRKGEIACNKQFLLFSQCFLPYMALIYHFKCTLTCRLQFVSIWTCLKFLSSSNGLKDGAQVYHLLIKISTELKENDELSVRIDNIGKKKTDNDCMLPDWRDLSSDNSLPDGNNFYSSKFKAFADEKLNVTQKTKLVFETENNIHRN